MIRAALLVTALMTFATGSAIAETIKPEEAIKYRRSVMTTIVWNFKPLAAMAKGEQAFNKELFVRNAQRIDLLAAMPLEGFMPGSDKGDTKAKADVWTNWDKFRGEQDRLQKESNKLLLAAQHGDEVAMKAQALELAKACKSCHDDFRLR